MKIVHAILALILLSVTVKAADEKSPDEEYAARLALAERNVRAHEQEAQKEKTWEKRAQNARDAYQAHHEEALRRESPAARAERENADYAAHLALAPTSASPAPAPYTEGGAFPTDSTGRLLPLPQQRRQPPAEPQQNLAGGIANRTNTKFVLPNSDVVNYAPAALPKNPEIVAPPKPGDGRADSGTGGAFLLPSEKAAGGDAWEPPSPPPKTSHRVDLEVGQSLNFRQLGFGPDMDLEIVDQSSDEIRVASLDNDHLRPVAVIDANGGATATMVPTENSWQVELPVEFSGPTARTLIFKSDQLRVFFVDEMDVRQNHVILEIERR